MRMIIILLLLFPGFIFSQKNQRDSLFVNESTFNISAGMGLKVISVKDVVDYVNYYIPYNQDEYKSIATAPDFYVNTEYRFSEKYGIKLEYSYILKTYNLENTKDILLYNISITYNIHSLSTLVDYIIREKGYLFKFGIGPSIYYSNFFQKTPMSRNEERFKSYGYGLKSDIYGHTQFGTNMYMSLGLIFQLGLISDLKNEEGQYLSSNKRVSMSFISTGICLGMAYYF